MRKIRRSTFETNSSSTHTLTMCTKEEYKKWKEGELFFINDLGEFVDEQKREEYIKKLIIREKVDISWQNKTLTYNGITVSFKDYEDKERKINEFQTKEELDKISKEELDAFIEDYGYSYDFPLTYDEYLDSIENTTYEQEYTTPKGEVIIAFGEYGYEG